MQNSWTYIADPWTKTRWTKGSGIRCTNQCSWYVTVMVLTIIIYSPTAHGGRSLPITQNERLSFKLSSNCHNWQLHTPLFTAVTHKWKILRKYIYRCIGNTLMKKSPRLFHINLHDIVRELHSCPVTSGGNHKWPNEKPSSNFMAKRSQQAPGLNGKHSQKLYRKCKVRRYLCC